jgi:hypothetical protein
VQHSDHNSSRKNTHEIQSQHLSPAHLFQQQLQQQQQLDAGVLPSVGVEAAGQAAAAALGVPVLTGPQDCLQLRPGSSRESGASGADVLVLPDVDMQLDLAAGSKAHQGDLPQQRQQQHIALAVDPHTSSKSSSSPHDSSSGIRSAAADPTPAGLAQTPSAAAPAGPSDIQQQQQQPDFWHSLRLLLRRPEVLIFMCQATAMGFGIGVIGEFLFLFLQELGGSETLMGLTLTFTCLAEVPVFHYQVCCRAKWHKRTGFSAPGQAVGSQCAW